jgi:hypothetical protein
LPLNLTAGAKTVFAVPDSIQALPHNLHYVVEVSAMRAPQIGKQKKSSSPSVNYSPKLRDNEPTACQSAPGNPLISK